MYEGIFNSLQAGPTGIAVALHYARMTKDPSGRLFSKDEVAERPQASKLVYATDFLQLFARDIKMSPEDLGPSGDMGFETDAAISRGRGG